MMTELDMALESLEGRAKAQVADVGGVFLAYKLLSEMLAKQLANMEAEVERLKASNSMMLASIEAVMAYEETSPEPPPYHEDLCIVSAYARGEWGNEAESQQ